MVRRALGRTGMQASPIGFGAFKIGRNEKTKYPSAYDLPDEKAVQALLDGVLDLGVNFIDTAPAYGLSEERIGRAVSSRRREFILSTKVGETFENGESRYDFSRAGVEASLKRSFERLRTDVLDLVFIHSYGNDLAVLDGTDVVETLCDFRKRGAIRAIGLSGKTTDGARASFEWADAIMVEYHAKDTSHEVVIREAAERGIAVIVKKGLASGHLAAADALRFVLSNRHVASVVVGGLNLDHIRANLAAAESATVSAT
jgi:aryl-alcohol dehydrogenase-like predicted oxidoreductase